MEPPASRNNYLNKFTSHDQRLADFIHRRRAEVKENQQPVTEVSFSNEVFEAQTASRRRTSRSPSGSTTSTVDLQDVNSEIRKMLRSVVSQINPSTPTLHSGSYSTSMLLRRLKDKLEALERLGKGLDDHRKALGESERALQTRISAVQKREAEIEEREAAAAQVEFEAQQKIQHMEKELESRNRNPRFEKMEEDLKQAAIQLERRTYDLLQEERLLEERASQLYAREKALTKAEKELQRRFAALETKEKPDEWCRDVVEEMVFDAILTSRETAIHKAQQALENSAPAEQSRAARLWESALAKLEHVQRAEKRLEQAKIDFHRESQRIKDLQESETARLQQWENTLRASIPTDKESEIRLLRAELLAKDGQLQMKEDVLRQTESSLEEKSQEMESLVEEIAKSLQSSPKKSREEVSDFAQTFRLRQTLLRRGIDAAEDEKREMSLTLKGFLADLP